MAQIAWLCFIQSRMRIVQTDEIELEGFFNLFTERYCYFFQSIH